jgi:LuxR family transcriptional regulator, maltose regulon positive regulatory protein
MPTKIPTSKRSVKGIPRPLPHEIPRARLLELLAGTESKVVALLAPSGYGKTTLLAQHARGLTQPVAWVTLTEDAAIPTMLAATVAKAVLEAIPKINLSGWETSLMVGDLPDRLARVLAEDLNAAEIGVHLVLDRGERLSSDSGRWLEAFIETLDEDHRVWVAGYEGLPLPLARYLAAGIATLIPASELNFTLEETQAYLQARNHVGDAVQIHQSLEGWSVGLALLVAGGGLQLQPKDLVLETLRRLPLTLQQSLLEAAVLEVWSEEAAASLGCALPKGWLKKAVDIGLPLTPLDAKQYRPHTVLIEALEIELSQHLERHTVLHKAMAAKAEQNGDLLLAVHHFQQAKDFVEACRLAEIIVTNAVEREENNLVRQLLETFLLPTLSTRLKLRLVQSWLNTGESARATELLQQVRDEGSRDPLMFSLLATLSNRQGHFEQQLQYIEEGFACNPEPRLQIALLMSKSAALYELGRFDEDVIVAEEAVRVAEYYGNKSLLATAWSVLAASYGAADKRADCKRAFHQSLERFEQLNMPMRQLGNYNNFANYLSDWGQLEEALTFTQRGMVIARQEPSFWLPLLLATRAIQFLRLGQFSEAIVDFEEAIKLCPDFGLEGFAYNYQLLSIQTLVLDGKIEVARQTLKEAQLERPDDASIQLNRLYFSQGLVAFFEGDFSSAKQHFSTINELFDRYDAPRVTAYLLEIARREGKLTRVLVGKLKTQLDDLGHREPLRMDVVPLRGLFDECVRRRWFTELFEPFKVLAPEILQPSVKPVLSIKTFGTIQLELNGQNIKLPFAKTAEILVWLALHGVATRDEIVLAIFGGPQSSSNLEYFKIAIRKLRSALSEHPDLRFNPLLYENGAYQINPELEVQLDAADFELIEPSVSTDQNLLSRVVQMYLGDFMPKIKTEWVLEKRRAFQEKVSSAAFILAQKLELGNPARAIELYKSAIAWNELEQEAYSRLAAVLEAQGNEIAATRVRKTWDVVLTRD